MLSRKRRRKGSDQAVSDNGYPAVAPSTFVDLNMDDPKTAIAGIGLGSSACAQETRDTFYPRNMHSFFAAILRYLGLLNMDSKEENEIDD